MYLSVYLPLCDAIVRLMDPLVEVVIHDLKSKTICYINGGLSKRKIGDPSLLNPKELKQKIENLVYPKLNFDGRLIKSISLPIEDKWLICINCDISLFNEIKNLSQKLLTQHQGSQPESLFKNDWQEKLHITLHSFLNEKGWTFENLNGNKKKEIIKYLFYMGAFMEKNAADYIADILTMSRATVFNHLKEERGNDN